MALTVKHAKVSAIPDDAASVAAGEVVPTDWNASHTITGDIADFVANPSVSVGLTAVNGSAITAMRSDGAPALDQTIAPTWTGAHTWTPAANVTPTTINGSNTGSNTLSGLLMNWTLNTSGSPGVVSIRVTDTASGASTAFLEILGGAAAATPIFSVSKGGAVVASAGYQANSSSAVQWNARGILTSPASATVQLGAAAAASPVAQTLQAQGSRAGTDNNIGGANLTLAAGNGTGIGTLSSLILQSPVAAASGTGAQTQTTGLTIKAGCAVRPSYTVTNLPAAATAGAGAMAWVTDANATTFLSVVAGGGANKVPVSSDGTNWLIG